MTVLSLLQQTTVPAGVGTGVGMSSDSELPAELAEVGFTEEDEEEELHLEDELEKKEGETDALGEGGTVTKGEFDGLGDGVLPTPFVSSVWFGVCELPGEAAGEGLGDTAGDGETAGLGVEVGG